MKPILFLPILLLLSWASLGRSWGSLGGLLGFSGVLLGVSKEFAGAKEPYWAPLGCSCCPSSRLFSFHLLRRRCFPYLGDSSGRFWVSKMTFQPSKIELPPNYHRTQQYDREARREATTPTTDKKKTDWKRAVRRLPRPQTKTKNGREARREATTPLWSRA